ncbi:MAG TPA: DNA-binding domain-containing protein, partial [Chryseolinea sp.]
MIKYSLFENRLTPDPDDQMAVVQPISTKSMEEVVDLMISRGSTVTKAEALSVMEELGIAMAQLLKDGHNVVTP